MQAMSYEQNESSKQHNRKRSSIYTHRMSEHALALNMNSEKRKNVIHFRFAADPRAVQKTTKTPSRVMHKANNVIIIFIIHFSLDKHRERRWRIEIVAKNENDIITLSLAVSVPLSFSLSTPLSALSVRAHIVFKFCLQCTRMPLSACTTV